VDLEKEKEGEGARSDAGLDPNLVRPVSCLGVGREGQDGPDAET
jgi:hypothetical protein